MADLMDRPLSPRAALVAQMAVTLMSGPWYVREREMATSESRIHDRAIAEVLRLLYDAEAEVAARETHCYNSQRLDPSRPFTVQAAASLTQQGDPDNG